MSVEQGVTERLFFFLPVRRAPLYPGPVGVKHVKGATRRGSDSDKAGGGKAVARAVVLCCWEKEIERSCMVHWCR